MVGSMVVMMVVGLVSMTAGLKGFLMADLKVAKKERLWAVLKAFLSADQMVAWRETQMADHLAAKLVIYLAFPRDNCSVA